jgi:hypothetical protein
VKRHRTTWFGPESGGMTLREIAGEQHHMDMQPISPDQPLTVTLSAYDWNVVMAGVNKLEHGIARPVFDRIGQQLQQQNQPQQMPMTRGNEVGLDRLHAETE